MCVCACVRACVCVRACFTFMGNGIGLSLGMTEMGKRITFIFTVYLL